jgi:hypothetical protein
VLPTSAVLSLAFNFTEPPRRSVAVSSSQTPSSGVDTGHACLLLTQRKLRHREAEGQPRSHSRRQSQAYWVALLSAHHVSCLVPGRVRPSDMRPLAPPLRDSGCRKSPQVKSQAAWTAQPWRNQGHSCVQARLARDSMHRQHTPAWTQHGGVPVTAARAPAGGPTHRTKVTGLSPGSHTGGSRLNFDPAARPVSSVVLSPANWVVLEASWHRGGGSRQDPGQPLLALASVSLPVRTFQHWFCFARPPGKRSTSEL